MQLLRFTSLIFALGLMVSQLFATTVSFGKSSEDIRTYDVQPFTKIHLEGAYKVVLEQGTHAGLKIKTDENSFGYIDVNSDAETLSLKISKKHFDFKELTLYITFVDLDKIDIDGGMSLETTGYVALKDFCLHVKGGASIEMNMKANRVNVIGEGGVKFEFDGIADELDASISGAGYIDAIDLKTKKTNIKVEGVGAGSVYATEVLNATIQGVGKIRYKGNPKVNKNIEGVGLVSMD